MLHPIFSRTQDARAQQQQQRVERDAAGNSNENAALSAQFASYGAHCPEFPTVSHVTQLDGVQFCV